MKIAKRRTNKFFQHILMGKFNDKTFSEELFFISKEMKGSGKFRRGSSTSLDSKKEENSRNFFLILDWVGVTLTIFSLVNCKY